MHSTVFAEKSQDVTTIKFVQRGNNARCEHEIFSCHSHSQPPPYVCRVSQLNYLEIVYQPPTQQFQCFDYK